MVIRPILAQNKQFIVKADAFLFEFVKKVSAFSYICFRIIGESSGNTVISVEKFAKSVCRCYIVFVSEHSQTSAIKRHIVC